MNKNWVSQIVFHRTLIDKKNPMIKIPVFKLVGNVAFHIPMHIGILEMNKYLYNIDFLIFFSLY